MKYLFFAVLVLLSCQSKRKEYGKEVEIKVKTPLNLNSQIEETKAAMAALGIGLRGFIEKDEPIVIVVDNTKPNFEAEFRPTSYTAISPNNPNRYYKKPVIKVSPLLQKVILGSDTTEFAKLNAYGYFVHELTHYLQATSGYEQPYIDARGSNSVEKYKAYMLQPAEFEAYAVAAYYFLTRYDSSLLKSIMNMDESKERKFEILINEERKIILPHKGLVFPE